MKKIYIALLFLFLGLIIILAGGYIRPKTDLSFKHTPEEIVNKFSGQFSKIKDARADITFDIGLQIFGCESTRRQKGYGIFKAPDKIKAVLNRNTYLFQGNSIRRTDPKGKLYYYQLIHAPDLSVGFQPRLIPHNFYLKMVKDDEEDIVIEGTPKPGVLKNVKKIFFHFDPKEYLLRDLKMSFTDKSIAGEAKITYEKINNIWMPVATFGKSAIETRAGTLAGFNFNLRGKNFRINTGITDDEFK